MEGRRGGDDETLYRAAIAVLEIPVDENGNIGVREGNLRYIPPAVQHWLVM